MNEEPVGAAADIFLSFVMKKAKVIGTSALGVIRRKKGVT